MAFDFEAVGPEVSSETQLQQGDTGTVVLTDTVAPEGRMKVAVGGVCVA